jgi:LuxR family maltose regulon positive regulatory protein
MDVRSPSRGTRPLTPGPGSTGVPRTELVERLSSLPDPVALVLVTAPPGYGKTTAVRQWASGTRDRVAWVRAGPEHRDRRRLVRDLAVALLPVGPVADVLGPLTTSPADVPGDGAAGRLAAAAGAAGAPVTIVLDELHQLPSRAALDLVVAVALRLPPGCRIVAVADRQPRLQVARLRSEGRCLDIGPGDLAFSLGETTALVQGSDLRLDVAGVAELHRRTEGWPAGVHLATLALQTGRGRVDVREIVGSNRLIADYFRDVVLASLSVETVRFLMRSAVLDRMCASLCDAVLRSTGSGTWLEEVNALGLFVVPDDADGSWFRYQRLFREMLRAELRRREPGEEVRILREAALWYAAHGLPEQAIDCAVAASDGQLAGRLIATHACEMTSRGRVLRVRAALDRVDQHALEIYPPLAVAAAWTWALTGDAAQARRALRIAEGSEFDAVMPDGSASFASATAVVRAALAPDGIDGMLADATRAVALEPAGSRWRTPAQLLVGVAHLLLGSAGEADVAFEEAARSASAGERLGVSVALALRSLTAAAVGDWRTADACASRARGLVDGDLWGSLTSIATFTAGAQVALHRGDTQQALYEVREAERLYREPSLVAFPWTGVVIGVLLGRLLMALGDVPAAEHKLTEARRALALLPTQGILHEQVDALANELDPGAHDGRRDATGLTAAELRVLRLLPTHYTLGEIGDELVVSRNTVKSQVAAIYRKLDVTSRADAVRRAQQVGLLEA